MCGVSYERIYVYRSTAYGSSLNPLVLVVLEMAPMSAGDAPLFDGDSFVHTHCPLRHCRKFISTQAKLPTGLTHYPMPLICNASALWLLLQVLTSELAALNNQKVQIQREFEAFRDMTQQARRQQTEEVAKLLEENASLHSRLAAKAVEAAQAASECGIESIQWTPVSVCINVGDLV